MLRADSKNLNVRFATKAAARNSEYKRLTACIATVAIQARPNISVVASVDIVVAGPADLQAPSVSAS